MVSKCLLTLALAAVTMIAETSACPAAGAAFRDSVSPGDRARALATTPRAHVTAQNAGAIRMKLNSFLKKGALAYPQHRACQDLSLEELDSIAHKLACLSNRELHTSYQANDGRRVSTAHRPRVHETKLDSQVSQALKSGMCHQVSLRWVHHLTQDGRAEFVKKHNTTFLPLLPISGADEHGPTLRAKGLHDVADWLEETVTCQVGHETRPEARDSTWTEKDFPLWPSEVTYSASGYGPYPFWTGGGGSGGALSGPGANISVKYSAVLNAEKLEHSACALSGLGTTDGACTHLFVNGSWSFLYKQDLSFCCMSSAPARYTPCHLTRPQRDFYKVMDYDGEIDYTSEDGLYTGKAKKWSMHLTSPSNFYFWYVTDPSGRPLEQGEGPCDMFDSDGGRSGCDGPPKMLFHQYHSDTFKEATLSASDFALPDICLDASKRTYCMVEPTNFCG